LPWKISVQPARSPYSWEGRNDYNTDFGPANVTWYEIAVAVELGDSGRALRVAATVDTAELSAERRAGMLIDVARARPPARQRPARSRGRLAAR
jgi:hypothetical protein